MESETYLLNICRLCLTSRSKENFKIFLEITENLKFKYEEVTQTNVIEDEFNMTSCAD